MHSTADIVPSVIEAKLICWPVKGRPTRTWTKVVQKRGHAPGYDPAQSGAVNLFLLLMLIAVCISNVANLSNRSVT